MTDESKDDLSGHTLEVFACPPDYSPSRFFTKYNKAYVPPIYHSNLTDVARSTSTDVLRLWGWTFDRLSEQTGNRKDAQEFGRYVSDHRDGIIPCGSSLTTEVFKSAYLRVLEALASTKLIDESSHLELSAIVCPLDLSLWQIGSNERPQWWPKASQTTGTLQSSEDWEKTSEIALASASGGSLVFAEGPLGSNEDVLQSSYFTLIPFGYRVTGKQLPLPEQIFRLLQRPTWSLDSLHPKMLSIFDVPLPEWIPDNHEGKEIGDLLLLPLLARIHSININCWQYWRGINPLVFPSVPLARGGRAAMHTRSWSLEDGGRSVYSGFSWINGPMRRLKFRYGEYGQFGTVDRKWLESILDEFDLRLGFVLRHDYRIRKSEHSEHETSSFAKLLRMDGIIVPDIAL
jgi:hypothetical protein